jgi:methylmalonyl-CoA mutase
MPTRPRHNVRIVTAAALFDGHDASINIMRRLLQDGGAEVIHLGHNRAAEEVVDAAIQEDAQGIAVSSYQGGHVEYFTYMRDLLAKKGSPHVKIYGGGGGVIVPREIKALHAAGIDRIFSPEDGRQLGLQGMIDVILEGCDYSTLEQPSEHILGRDLAQLSVRTPGLTARLITAAELLDAPPPKPDSPPPILRGLLDVVYPTADRRGPRAPIVGITGPGGAGKSSLTDEIVLRFLRDFPDKTIAVLSVDPTKKRTGGALLGDRIRMNAISSERVYMRSLATRTSSSELSGAIGGAIRVCQAAGFDLIIVESAGTGQKDAAISAIADVSLYVMTAEFGAQSQLEKIEMIDIADAIAINKFERRGSLDALRDVRKQYRRTRKIFDQKVSDESLPVFGTIASQFNDPGVTRLYLHLLGRLARFTSHIKPETLGESQKPGVIPPKHVRYLSEVAEACRAYRSRIGKEASVARRVDSFWETLEEFGLDREALVPFSESDIEEKCRDGDSARAMIMRRYNERLATLSPWAREAIASLPQLYQRYGQDELVYEVRGREVHAPLISESLSHLQIQKVILPRYLDWGDLLEWIGFENVPGSFPFTAGVFPLKRTGEDPARMFAGEGPPEQTNARFHLLSKDQPAVRLSTAFDSVTLYGEDPHERPDIFGKVGESGVSIATIEDAEKLYAGFDLCSPNTSVSMTINGPAPIILAFFMNAAVRQQVRRHLIEQGKLKMPMEAAFRPDLERGTTWESVRALVSDAEYEVIRKATVSQVRGTVQADILKEDQAQNTCIFSTEFALKMMGDIQEYFIEEDVKNYYSVSISGYHIAEAGANPITQLALTLANGFTYVQYYLSRGMKVDDFAPNLSFFFSNGLDPEYAVIGRVARRIWAVAMRDHYGASERSQKLKYHVQTSGRSLHAMEMDFNDIRTTLQALMAIEDNCNSLHTNAFDEALTTPTESSVRRALAIQMIINKELGLAKNENSLQGSFIVEELTDLVEAAVLEEFDRLTERGGVLGAMETQYQRSKIQEESLYYERMKHDGSLPIIGVNTFTNPHARYEEDADKVELRRSPSSEKERCIANLRGFQDRHSSRTPEALERLRLAALGGQNIFRELMHTVNHASLGQISHALYEVGGQYRRNM